jgi:hypothetical protein
VKLWIDDCLRNHPDCPALKDTILPTRVLKVTDSDNIKLYTPNPGGTGAYIALSYCWGGPQLFATTISTIDQLSKGFHLSELPQTLQDAVLVTKKLGLQYLWVDALCIIQDSLDEKATELPKLSSYYNNSRVTICAGGSSVNDGFLKPKHECHSHPGAGMPQNLLKMPYMCPADDEESAEEGKAGSIYFCEETPHFLSWEPVFQRAWTLQEQLLSPRFLYYGQRLIWQCQSTQRADGGVEDWSIDANAPDHSRIRSAITNLKTEAAITDGTLNIDALNLASTSPDLITAKLQRQTLSSGSVGINEDDGHPRAEAPLIYQLWYQTVRGFSRRNISFACDRLPAIAGLATEIASSTGDTYLAGLWRSQMLRELMWSTYPTLYTFKPEVWRAPTWSWASVDNDINFERLPDNDFRAVAKVTRCETTLLQPGNEFGEVSSGRLDIRGPIINMDREAVLIMLKHEFARKPPTGESFASMCRDANLLPQDGRKQDEPDGWALPEHLRLLVLWAKVVKEESVGAGKERSNQAEIDSTEKGREMPKEEEGETEDMSCGGGSENNGPQKITVACTLAGLVLHKREDGRYERVSSFSKVRLDLSGGDLFEWLGQSLESLEIV